MINPITDAILELSDQEGLHQTMIPEVFTFLHYKPEKAGPQLYRPSLIFIGSGSKTLYLNGEKLLYGNGNFLLSAVHIPIVCEPHTEDGKPFAGVSIKLERSILFDLVKDIKKDIPHAQSKKNLQPGIISLPVSKDIYQTLLRILTCCKSDQDSRILGAGLVRELLYYVIGSTTAETFFDLVGYNDTFVAFTDILEKIHSEYDRPIFIEKLAKDMNMSIPTFHRQFKSFTGNSPLQYIKNIRFAKAKSLLTLENKSVKETANLIGYTSQSQFSREYKKYFGFPPSLSE